MIIDTHCHYDIMPSPEIYIQEVEQRGDCVIGMTNLPRHFVVGRGFVSSYQHVRLALGFHPQLVANNLNQLTVFKENIDNTSYIGEIGLDFSKDYIETKDTQIKSLDQILGYLENKRKIISVHSRGAEIETLSLLRKHNIRNVIFHWYSGSPELVPAILNCGYYFSINEAMTRSASGRRIIECVPSDRILTESDAPYNIRNSIKNALNNMGISEQIVEANFKSLLKNISSK